MGKQACPVWILASPWAGCAASCWQGTVILAVSCAPVCAGGTSAIKRKNTTVEAVRSKTQPPAGGSQRGEAGVELESAAARKINGRILL